MVEKRREGVIIRRSSNPRAAPAWRRVPEDDAMEDRTKKPGDGKEIPAFGPDRIEMGMRTRMRECSL